MMLETFDVVVLGSGPAGMAAAITAAELGMRVVVLDEQEAPGGQIYRGITSPHTSRQAILGADYLKGQKLAEDFRNSGALYEANAAVWQLTRERVVSYVQAGTSRSIQARQVIACTGAMERPMPIPGWTLPGVLTAGAAQILLKQAGAVPTQPVVLAGCGPLLYLLAAQYLRAGVPIAAMVLTTQWSDYRRAAPYLAAALAGWPWLKKGLSLIATLKRAGVRFYSGATGLAVIEQNGAAAGLRFTANGQAQQVDSKVVLLHQGVVPNTQISWALRAGHVWNPTQLCWTPVTDDWGQLDVPGIFVAGDSSGIGGAEAAVEQGRLAALAAARQLGGIDLAQRDRLARAPRQALRRALAVRPFLEALYTAPRENRIPADEVVICRCEEVTAGEIRRAVALGCLGPNQTKSFSRCGMGPCQGRQCGLTVTELIAAERGVAAAAVGYYRIRSPLKSITLRELANDPGGVAASLGTPGETAPSTEPASLETSQLADSSNRGVPIL